MLSNRRFGRPDAESVLVPGTSLPGAGMTGPDGGNPAIGFNHIASSADHKQMIGIPNNEQRFQPPQCPILAPVFR